MITNENIIEGLEKLRIQKNKTIQYLTDGIMSNRNYSRLLNGEASINLDELNEMLKRLYVPFDDFVLYLDTMNRIKYYPEEYFVLLVLYSNYEKAAKVIKTLENPKELHTYNAINAFPAALACLDYYQKKISLEALREYLKALVKINEIRKNKIVHAPDIYTIYFYIRVAKNEEKERLIEFLKELLDKNEYQIISSDYIETKLIAYIALITGLTTLDKVTKEVDYNVSVHVEQALNLISHARFSPFDTIFYETIYQYAQKYRNDKIHYTVFYYIASIISTSNNDFLRGRTFEITEEDIALYNELMNDDKFVQSQMFKWMKLYD